MLPRTALLAPALLLLVACGGEGGSAEEDAPAEPVAGPYEAAFETCSQQIDQSMQDEYAEDAPPIVEVMQLEDDGSGITVLTADPGGSILAGVAFSAAECVLGETGAPSSVVAKMQSTTALMGRQEESWEDLSVEWSYSAADLPTFEAFFATA